MDSETLDKALQRISENRLFCHYVIAKDQMHMVKFDQPIVYIVQNTDRASGTGEKKKKLNVPPCNFCIVLFYLYSLRDSLDVLGIEEEACLFLL